MSALIWVAIVVVWGFVLIPMWLRHHDTMTEQRSTERFTVAMRVLSRRPAGRVERAADGFGGRPADALTVGGMAMSQADSDDPEGPAVPGPGRQAAGFGARGRPADPEGSGDPVASIGPADMVPSAPVIDADAASGAGAPSDAHPDGARPDQSGLAGPRSGDARDARDTSPLRRVDVERAARMRARRQRLFVLLAVLPISVILAAVFGGMWIAVQIIVDAGLAAYVIHLRRTAREERRLAQARAAFDRRLSAEWAVRSRRPPIGSSFAYREREPGQVHGRSVDDLTEEELAIAGAETIDLGALLNGQPGLRAWDAHADGSADDEDDDEDGADWEDGGAHYPGLSNGDVAWQPPAHQEPAYGRCAYGTADPGGHVQTSPGARTTISRPGRVQANPPGTHGGMVSPAPVAAGSQLPGVSAAETPVADGSPISEAGEIDPLLHRHAVGS